MHRIAAIMPVIIAVAVASVPSLSQGQQALPVPPFEAPPPVRVFVGEATDGKLQPPPPDALAELEGPVTLQQPVAKIHFYATDVGFVLGVEPVYTMLPRNEPWRIRVSSQPMEGQEPSNEGHTIAPSRIYVHELKSDPAGVGWVACDGTTFLQSAAGDPDGWLYLEFRILVEQGDPPGHYMSHANLFFQCAGFQGNFPLELHLNVPQLFSMTLEGDFDFPDTAGNFTGWMYTIDEGKLTIRSNMDFTLAFSEATDLTGPGDKAFEIETAFRLRQPFGSGVLWQTWGDFGGDESGHGTPDLWTGPPDPGAPWPGTVQGVNPVVTQGINEIGLRGAAWRKGVDDLAGDYAGTFTITVAPALP